MVSWDICERCRFKVRKLSWNLPKKSFVIFVYSVFYYTIIVRKFQCLIFKKSRGVKLSAKNNKKTPFTDVHVKGVPGGLRLDNLKGICIIGSIYFFVKFFGNLKRLNISFF